MSFHNAYNYGAALQAYGLQCAVERIGFECEYINYVNDYRRNSYDMIYQLKSALKERKWIRAVKVAVGIPFIGKRKKVFDKFYSKHLRKTATEYHTSKEAQILNDKYDRFVVGSDQVWNPENNGSDMAFLLDFVENPRKKISYSSSFGIGEIPEEFSERYEKCLSDFSCLAVRESRGVDLVHSLTGKNATLVLDPVFLAGVPVWDSLRKTDNWTQKKKYVFFYTNGTTQVNDFLMTGYKMTGLEKHILSSHVTPFDFIDPNTKVCSSISPERFINEIANAELVVTASFHCLAFAIMYHKQFSVILTGDYGKDERIVSMLKILGLEDRVLSVNTSLDDINKKINYDLVEEKLSKFYNQSYDYLKKSLKDGAYDSIENNESSKKYHCEDNRCTGCGACAFACPTKAIQMRVNEEGFEIPVRDPQKCIDCGKCAKICQVFSAKKEPLKEQKFYAAKNSDEIRKISSSGGCFTALSDYILKTGGVVCAAAMDEDFHVKHVLAFNEDQRYKMRGTFYVQSSVADCYAQISECLKQDKKVFFVGTPCQVAGVQSVFKNNENLITCDLICHGSPSPLVFEKFTDYLKQKGDLKSFAFRDKDYGCRGYTVSATYGDKKIGNKLWLNSFNNMFSHSMINRLSCASCKYCNYDRPGDITIGDFWGLEKSHPELLDGKGISLLIVNTKKGKELLSNVKGLSLVEVDKKETIQNSLKKPANISSCRFQAMRTIAEDDYEIAARKYGEYNIKGFVKNFVRRMMNA